MIIENSRVNIKFYGLIVA